MARSKIELRADYTRYDLTRYGPPSSTDPAFADITTALPWNDDLYLRLSFHLSL
jgi:hypothetical protein